MPFIILDRDGVINYDSDEYIKSPEEWLPIPGSLEAIVKLNRAGFRVLVVTNQSGVARGLYDLSILERIHTKLSQSLTDIGGQIEEILFCPHHPDENCLCRKPKPGLLYQIQKKYPVNFAQTFFVGDSIADVYAAREVGCKPMLVLTGKGEQSLAAYPELLEIPHFADLAKAVEFILSLSQK